MIMSVEPGSTPSFVPPSSAVDAVDRLIATIKPTRNSIERRYGVQDFVRRIITRCFHPEKVNAYMFGSVPLRTYLPDGDIDLSVFCLQEAAQAMRDNWALNLQSVIEQEQSSGNAPYKIGDVTVINAEVKLLKCLVDNIVVDISFNQMGGLVTLNFLEEINSLIGRSNIFKRSIILVKAWCYYESRLLGAHHGLISTYALETLVLYVFNKYHGSLDSPLAVLYNFLVEFSNFDWDRYCLSLLGPVPLKDLPNAKVEASLAPQNTLLQGDSRLAESLARFRAEMASSKADSGSKAFVIRCLNIMDPLLPSNNLGRSVVRSSFARIRRAFGHGAALLRCMAEKDGEAAVQDLDRLFRNTWAALRKHKPAAVQQHQQGPLQLDPRLQVPRHLQVQLPEQQPQPLIKLEQRQGAGQPLQKGDQQQPFHVGNGVAQAAVTPLQPQTHMHLQQQQQLSNMPLALDANMGLVNGSVHHQLYMQQLQLQQQQLLQRQQQQQCMVALQHNLGPILLEAAAGAGMSLDAFLSSRLDQQVAVLLKYLGLPPSIAATDVRQPDQPKPPQQGTQQHQQQHQERQQQGRQLLEPVADSTKQKHAEAAAEQQQQQQGAVLELLADKHSKVQPPQQEADAGEADVEDVSKKASSDSPDSSAAAMTPMAHMAAGQKHEGPSSDAQASHTGPTAYQAAPPAAEGSAQASAVPRKQSLLDTGVTAAEMRPVDGSPGLEPNVAAAVDRAMANLPRPGSPVVLSPAKAQQHQSLSRGASSNVPSASSTAAAAQPEQRQQQQPLQGLQPVQDLLPLQNVQPSQQGQHAGEAEQKVRQQSAGHSEAAAPELAADVIGTQGACATADAGPKKAAELAGQCQSTGQQQEQLQESNADAAFVPAAVNARGHENALLLEQSDPPAAGAVDFSKVKAAVLAAGHAGLPEGPGFNNRLGVQQRQRPLPPAATAVDTAGDGQQWQHQQQQGLLMGHQQKSTQERLLLLQQLMKYAGQLTAATQQQQLSAQQELLHQPASVPPVIITAATAGPDSDAAQNFGHSRSQLQHHAAGLGYGLDRSASTGSLQVPANEALTIKQPPAAVVQMSNMCPVLPDPQAHGQPSLLQLQQHQQHQTLLQHPQQHQEQQQEDMLTGNPDQLTHNLQMAKGYVFGRISSKQHHLLQQQGMRELAGPNNTAAGAPGPQPYHHQQQQQQPHFPPGLQTALGHPYHPASALAAGAAAGAAAGVAAGVAASTAMSAAAAMAAAAAAGFPTNTAAADALLAASAPGQLAAGQPGADVQADHHPHAAIHHHTNSLEALTPAVAAAGLVPAPADVLQRLGVADITQAAELISGAFPLPLAQQQQLLLLMQQQQLCALQDQQQQQQGHVPSHVLAGSRLLAATQDGGAAAMPAQGASVQTAEADTLAADAATAGADEEGKISAAPSYSAELEQQQQQETSGVADASPAAAPAVPVVTKYMPPHKRPGPDPSRSPYCTGITSPAPSPAGADAPSQRGACESGTAAGASDSSADAATAAEQVAHAIDTDATGIGSEKQQVTAGDSSAAAAVVAGVPQHMAPIRTGSVSIGMAAGGSSDKQQVLATETPVSMSASAEITAGTLGSGTGALLIASAMSGRTATPKTPLSAKAASFVPKMSSLAPPAAVPAVEVSAVASAAAAAAPVAIEGVDISTVAVPIAKFGASVAGAAAAVELSAVLTSAGSDAASAAAASGAEQAAPMHCGPSSSQQARVQCHQQQQAGDTLHQQLVAAQHQQVMLLKQQHSQLAGMLNSGGLQSPNMSFSSYDTAESVHFESTPGTPVVHEQGSQGGDDSMGFDARHSASSAGGDVSSRICGIEGSHGSSGIGVTSNSGGGTADGAADKPHNGFLASRQSRRAVELATASAAGDHAEGSVHAELGWRGSSSEVGGVAAQGPQHTGIDRLAAVEGQYPAATVWLPVTASGLSNTAYGSHQPRQQEQQCSAGDNGALPPPPPPPASQEVQQLQQQLLHASTGSVPAVAAPQQGSWHVQLPLEPTANLSSSMSHALHRGPISAALAIANSAALSSSSSGGSGEPNLSESTASLGGSRPLTGQHAGQLPAPLPRRPLQQQQQSQQQLQPQQQQQAALASRSCGTGSTPKKPKLMGSADSSMQADVLVLKCQASVSPDFNQQQQQEVRLNQLTAVSGRRQSLHGVAGGGSGPSISSSSSYVHDASAAHSRRSSISVNADASAAIAAAESAAVHRITDTGQIEPSSPYLHPQQQQQPSKHHTAMLAGASPCRSNSGINVQALQPMASFPHAAVDVKACRNVSAPAAAATGLRAAAAPTVRPTVAAAAAAAAATAGSAPPQLNQAALQHAALMQVAAMNAAAMGMIPPDMAQAYAAAAKALHPAATTAASSAGGQVPRPFLDPALMPMFVGMPGAPNTNSQQQQQDAAILRTVSSSSSSAVPAGSSRSILHSTQGPNTLPQPPQALPGMGHSKEGPSAGGTAAAGSNRRSTGITAAAGVAVTAAGGGPSSGAYSPSPAGNVFQRAGSITNAYQGTAVQGAVGLPGTSIPAAGVPSSPHKLPPNLSLAPAMVNTLNPAGLAGFAPVAFPGGLNPAAFALPHAGLMGPWMTALPVLHAAYAAPSGPAVAAAAAAAAAPAGGLLRPQAVAASGAAVPPVQRQGSGTRHTSSVTAPGPDRHMDAINAVGATASAGSAHDQRQGSGAAAAAAVSGLHGTTSGSGLPSSRQGSMTASYRDQQQQYRDPPSYYREVREQQQQQQLAHMQQHQQLKEQYREQQQVDEQHHAELYQFGRREPSQHYQREPSQTYRQQYTEQQHHSEHYKEVHQQQAGQYSQLAPGRFNTATGYVNDPEAAAAVFSSRQAQQQQHQVLAGGDRADSNAGSAGFYAGPGSSRCRPSQGSETGLAGANVAASYTQQRPMMQQPYRQQGQLLQQLQQQQSGGQERASEYRPSQQQLQQHLHRNERERQSSSELQSPYGASPPISADGGAASGRSLPGTGVFNPAVPVETQPLQSQQLQQQQGQRETPPARDLLAQQQQQQQRPRSFGGKSSRDLDMYPVSRTASGSSTSSAFQLVLSQQQQQQDSWGGEPAKYTGLQHPEHQARRASRLGQSQSDSGIAWQPALADAEGNRAEYASSSSSRATTAGGDAPVPPAAVPLRPRVPVAAVVSLVQAAAEDRERQSRQQRERSSRTAAAAAALTARVAAAAAAAATAATPPQASTVSAGEAFAAAAAADTPALPPSAAAGASAPSALPVHIVRLRSGGGFSAGASSTGGSSGGGTPRAGSAGAVDAAGPGSSTAAGGGSSEAPERRRSRVGGVPAAGLSRLFTQAMHRVVEDHQQSPLAATVSGGSSVSGAFPGEQQQQQMQQGHIRQPSEGGSTAGSSSVGGNAAGGAAGQRPGSATVGVKRPAAAAAEPQQRPSSSHAIRPAAAAGAAASVVNTASSTSANSRSGTRRLAGKRSSQEEVQQQHQSAEGGQGYAGTESQRQSSSAYKAGYASAKPGGGNSSTKGAGASVGTGPSSSQTEHKQQQQQQGGSFSTPALDDVAMFPSLPSATGATISGNSSGKTGWVNSSYGAGGSSSSSSRRASADDGAAPATSFSSTGATSSSSKQNRGQQQQHTGADSVAGGFGESGTSSSGREGRSGKSVVRSAASGGDGHGATAAPAGDNEMFGGRGAKQHKGQGQHGGSKLMGQEFQLADEDFPTLNAAVAATGKAGGLSRQGSMSKIAGSSRAGSRQGVREEDDAAAAGSSSSRQGIGKPNRA